jgi:hypothetical protein
MRATFVKKYSWPGERKITRSRGIIVVKGKPGSNNELAPEQMYSKTQLDRIHNAIRFTQNLSQ